MALIPTIPTSAFPPVNNLELSEKIPASSSSSTSTSQNNIKSTPTTSKKWVLPPRPKPGRKSSANHTLNSSTTPNTTNIISQTPERSDSISTSISHLRINSPAPAPLTPDSLSPAEPSSVTSTKAATSTTIASSQKSSSKHNSITSSNSKNTTFGIPKSTTRMVEIDSEIIHNPIKQSILKINEENYYLKLEVIRLVSNLKSLRDESNTNNTLSDSQQDSDKKEKKTKKKIKRKQKSISSPQSKIDDPIPSNQSNLDNNIRPSINSTSITTTNTPKTLSPVLLLNSSENTNLNNDIPHSKKRSHDETNNDLTNNDDDINNLIVSLVDLSHTQNSASLSPQHSQHEFNSDPTLIDVDDDMDMLSSVSTTPSTMFSLSLSLSTTNDTISSSSIPPTIPTMQFINEQPTFELLDLPTEENLREGKLDLKMNYELEETDMKLPLLNTFDTLNSLDYESNFLMETTDLEKNPNLGEAVSSNSLELLNFGTDDDVELEFSKFVNGERSNM